MQEEDANVGELNSEYEDIKSLVVSSVSVPQENEVKNAF